ncbi:hypothetical protein [Anaerophilus nitritogenes]|uniref:hypothetical protein n=1 Tax=Anaerophilus nitritogenes TaxID=2498136 RepID=UPI00101DBEF8|nr:hypothetical protein [Anaerophilus nitritogenes]
MHLIHTLLLKKLFHSKRFYFLVMTMLMIGFMQILIFSKLSLNAIGFTPYTIYHSIFNGFTVSLFISKRKC